MNARPLENGVWVCGTSHHSIWCENGLVHDPLMAGVIQQNCPKDAVAINVGAHIGSLARVMIDLGCKTICFEPSAEAIKCLRHNCPEAEIHFNALWDREDILSIEPSEDVGNSGANRIGEGPIVCHGITLDSLNLSPDFILADCEGSELNFLIGATRTIDTCRPRMILEVNRKALGRMGASPEDVFELLDQHGYSFAPIQEIDVRAALQFDVLCLPIGDEVPRPLEQKHEETGFAEVPCGVVRYDIKDGKYVQSPYVDQKPWDDKEDSLHEIKKLAARLKLFCSAPMYVKRVRDALREAGVIR